MQVMQTETIIIMIVGLLAIGLIRFVIAMVGREYAADHPHVKSQGQSEGGGTDSLPAVSSQRPVRGTGKKSHLYHFPTAQENAPVDAKTPDVTTESAAS